MKDLNISNYKCLEKIQISGLKKVNLFTGKNNTGKSTILEALSLFASKGNFQWIHHLLSSRGEINNYRDENINEDINIKLLSAFFSHRKFGFSSENVISINSDNDSLSLRFVKYITEDIVEKDSEGKDFILSKKRIIINEKESDNDNLSYGFEIENDGNTNMYNLDRHLFRRRSSSSLANNFHLINAKGDDILDSAILWDKITLSEKEDLVISALKIIEPKITRLSFVGDSQFRSERYPIVKLEGVANLYPLKAMGDGINRILNLTLALVNSDNGFLLIDEFENGLHYSVQEKLWEIIFEISNRLNIQVFVTTHSNDSINAFAKILSKSEKFDGSLYRLQRKENEVFANPFSEEEIKIASSQQINLR